MVSLPPGRFPAIALIVVLGIAAYFNSLDNGFHYDDEHSILENHHVRSLLNLPAFFLDPGTFSGLPQARMYRPVLLVTYALNYAVGGYEPFGYHLVNLFLHLLNVLLGWRLAGALGNGRGALCGAERFAERGAEPGGEHGGPHAAAHGPNTGAVRGPDGPDARAVR